MVKVGQTKTAILERPAAEPTARYSIVRDHFHAAGWIFVNQDMLLWLLALLFWGFDCVCSRAQLAGCYFEL